MLSSFFGGFLTHNWPTHYLQACRKSNHAILYSFTSELPKPSYLSVHFRTRQASKLMLLLCLGQDAHPIATHPYLLPTSELYRATHLPHNPELAQPSKLQDSLFSLASASYPYIRLVSELSARSRLKKKPLLELAHLTGCLLACLLCEQAEGISNSIACSTNRAAPYYSLFLKKSSTTN